VKKKMNDTYNPEFMKRALELSRAAYRGGKGLPIGCVIVKDGQIVGEGHNEIFHRANPTAHAEMVAIEAACAKTGALSLSGCDLYTTLEPCPMCAAAVYWAKIRSVFFATSGNAGAKCGFNDDFIRSDLAKSPQQRLIPHFWCDVPEADKMLEECGAAGFVASQPFELP
jgi:tRNA(Arg) A34 adenosine deaminase TadA